MLIKIKNGTYTIENVQPQEADKDYKVYCNLWKWGDSCRPQDSAQTLISVWRLPLKWSFELLQQALEAFNS